MTRALLVLALAPLAACVRPPANLAGTYERVTVREAQAEPREGVAVRWGGTLISARPGKGQTCFEVASFPLDARARPKPSDQSAGRFIACAPGFYEPAVYAPGREVTVTGALHGTVRGRVGQYEYTYPRLDATAVYLWPERSPDEMRPMWWPSIGIGVGGVFFR
jgi:outer membrane lipoprotein